MSAVCSLKPQKVQEKTNNKGDTHYTHTHIQLSNEAIKCLLLKNLGEEDLGVLCSVLATFLYSRNYFKTEF